jgi:hypothetical protein
LTTLLVAMVAARVALAPSRSDAVGALAATIATWTISGRGNSANVAQGGQASDSSLYDANP